MFEGGYGSDYWDEIIKRFEDAYPGVTVNMQISPKIGDIIRPQIVAGNVPDFISMNDNDSTGLISSMVKEHALMDLSDVFEEGGIDDDTPLKDQVIDGLLDSAKCSPCTIKAVNTDLDHIHILFEAPPQVQLSKLANNYKTVTSRLIRKNFSEQLKPYYWKPYFWSDSYFVCSVSDRTESAVKSYIDSQ